MAVWGEEDIVVEEEGEVECFDTARILFLVDLVATIQHPPELRTKIRGQGRINDEYEPRTIMGIKCISLNILIWSIPYLVFYMNATLPC